MNALTLIDLDASIELDQDAMAAITGAGRTSYQWRGWGGTSSSRWSRTNIRNIYQGQKFHGGYLSKHYIHRQTYKRTQTKNAYWNKFVRV